MTVRKILVCGNPLLRKKSKAVKGVDQDLRKLVQDLAETMYDSNGAGIAAVQVGELKRVILIDISEAKDQLMVFLNPKIVSRKGERPGTEACLSVPKFEGEVVRSETIVVKAKTMKFDDIEIEVSGYLAVAFQHEIDHCDGILYIDKVEPGKLKPSNDKA